MRAETGVLKFEDDWPGIFLRGDTAMATAFWLEQVIHKAEAGQVLSDIDQRRMRGLLNLLYSCDQRQKPVCQEAQLISSPPSEPPRARSPRPASGS